MKPLVLLDIDGVVNAWRGVYADDAPVYTHSVSSQVPVRVVVSQSTVVALRHLAVNADRIMWCSSWRHHANLLLPWLSHLVDGVTPSPAWDVITDTHNGSSSDAQGTGWKLHAVATNAHVRNALERGQEVVWFEDFGWNEPWPSPIPRGEVERLGVAGVDTYEVGYLLPSHLPPSLR